MDIPLDEVVYVEGIASSATGAAVDADLTPTFVVFEEATDADIGVGGNMTKRTSLTGDYRASFTASAANGFEVGKWYAVVGSATIGGIACKGVLKHFRIVAAEAVAGKPKVDVDAVAGTAQTAGDLMATLTTLTTRIPAALFSGITSMAQWLGLIAGKQTGNSTARTELRATGAGSGTYDETTDSLEANRDNIGTNGAALSDLDLGDLADEVAATVSASLSGREVSVSSPVISNTEIELVVGDDYYNADGNALEFTFTGITASWASATPTLRIAQGDANNTITGTVVTATGSTRVCRFEPTSAETGDYVAGTGTFHVGVVLANSHVTTPLTDGVATFKARVPAAS